jgi:hypothetical protein
MEEIRYFGAGDQYPVGKVLRTAVTGPILLAGLIVRGE